MSAKPKSKPKTKAAATEGRLFPPKNGAVVRMYRIGHGDCFLLAFAGQTAAKPCYVLIDCGYKPGSQKTLGTTADEIVQNIATATGGQIDLAVITHEHQDHVNGISAKRFQDIDIKKVWLAWTEDPEDKLANRLRRAYQDKLLGLVAARNQLAAGGDEDQAKFIDSFLASELGGEGDLSVFAAAAADPSNSANKKAMQVWKAKAEDVDCLRPHEAVLAVPGAKSARAFVLGPPRDEDKLKDLDPVGGEEFHLRGVAGRSVGGYFAAAAQALDGTGQIDPKVAGCPFPPRYRVPWQAAGQYQVDSPATAAAAPESFFFTDHYGITDQPVPKRGRATPSEGVEQVLSNADWRRIDHDWLHSAEALALAMNNDTNNSSLVLAFELEPGGKVLLFVGDAQRGNWISWGDGTWEDPLAEHKNITITDLLHRTVLYKAGHHGSHNATLNGTAADAHPNLSQMAQGKHRREFTAMITAVRAWAKEKAGWNHPLPAIKDALQAKASGRVFQTDTDWDKMKKPAELSETEWGKFRKRCRGEKLYFDCEFTG
jgi:beta-lactamase superfamily II metal-dependent hydrolase